MSPAMQAGVMGTIGMYEMTKLRKRVEELERRLLFQGQNYWTVIGTAPSNQQMMPGQVHPWQGQQQGCWPGSTTTGTVPGYSRAVWTAQQAHGLMNSLVPDDDGGAA